jgi:hypothetical protein
MSAAATKREGMVPKWRVHQIQAGEWCTHLEPRAKMHFTFDTWADALVVANALAVVDGLEARELAADGEAPA